MNQHFQAAVKMASILPYILTKEAKYNQERGILSKLLDGLKEKK